MRLEPGEVLAYPLSSARAVEKRSVIDRYLSDSPAFQLLFMPQVRRWGGTRGSC